MPDPYPQAAGIGIRIQIWIPNAGPQDGLMNLSLGAGWSKGFDAGSGSNDWDEMDPKAHAVVKDPDPKSGLHSIVYKK
jgi:hypothetical protein